MLATNEVWITADTLQSFNPSWDDERVYQESRRIVGAEIQQITFNEFLPILLGQEYLQRFQLKPLEPGSEQETHLYDSNINPSVTNEFATAAYRVGHSLIQGIIEYVIPSKNKFILDLTTRNPL